MTTPGEWSSQTKIGKRPDLYGIACDIKAAVASSSMDGLDMGIVVAYIAADAFHQAHWLYWMRDRIRG